MTFLKKRSCQGSGIFLNILFKLWSSIVTLSALSLRCIYGRFTEYRSCVIILIVASGYCRDVAYVHCLHAWLRYFSRQGIVASKIYAWGFCFQATVVHRACNLKTSGVCNLISRQLQESVTSFPGDCTVESVTSFPGDCTVESVTSFPGDRTVESVTSFPGDCTVEPVTSRP